MGNKVLKNVKFKVVCIILVMCTFVYAFIGNTFIVKTSTNDLNNANLGKDSVEYYTGPRTSAWGFSIKNNNFDPDALNLTPDKIIKEAASNLNQNYKMGNKGYGDAWGAVGNESAVWNKTSTKSRLALGRLDCSGLAYRTYRNLGVQLTNFCDGRGFSISGYRRVGPVPLNTDSWVNTQLNKNGTITVKPYHVTWANGEEIAQITPYVISKVWIDATNNQGKYAGYRDTVTTYEEFIREYNVAPGSIVVTINPNKLKGVKGAEHHAWMYIGNFDDKDAAVNYLKSLGVDSKLFTEYSVAYDPNGGKAWSIESCGSGGPVVNGKNLGIVRITNKDPGGAETFETGKEGKRGNGYIAFTLVNNQEGSYDLNIVKKSVADQGNLADISTALDGAQYNISLNNGTAKQVTTDGKTLVQNVKITNENVLTPDVYTITETSAPSGYNVSNELQNVELKVYKAEQGNTYIVDHVEVMGQTIQRGQSKDSIVLEENAAYLGISLSSNGTDLTVTVYNDKDNYYNLRLFKQAGEDLWWSSNNSIASAEFSVKQFTKTGNGVYSLNDTIAVTSNDNKATNFIFNENQYNAYDNNSTWKGVLLSADTVQEDFYRYVITETKSPDVNQYNVPDFIIEGKSLVVDVTPQSKGDGSYDIQKLDVYVARVDENGNMSDVTVIKENLQKNTETQVSDPLSNEVYVNFANNLDINIGFKDPLVEGDYNVYLGKVERSDNAVWNNVNYIPDAEYEIIKAVDVDPNLAESIDFNSLPDTPAEGDDIPVVTTSDLSVAFENIEVNSVDNCDVYLIRETKNAKHYNLDYNEYKLIVYKKIAENVSGKTTLSIDHINLYKYDTLSEEPTWEEITDKENAKEATVKLEDNNIMFIASDVRKTYDLALDKTIVYSADDVIDKYDIDMDGIITAGDASSSTVIYMSSIPQEEIDEVIKETDEELATIADNYNNAIYDEASQNSEIDLSNYREVTKDNVKNIVASMRINGSENYKYMDAEYIFLKWMAFDEDNNGRVSLSEVGETILQKATSAGVGADDDRFISAVTKLLNTLDGENNKITTAQYNLTKTTHKVKKNDVITYRIDIYNEGDYDAKNVEIVDYIPDGLIICDSQGNKVTEGTVEYTISSKGKERNYAWQVSDNGKKATFITPNDITINKFEYVSRRLDYTSAYIKCCVDYVGKDDTTGQKIFNDEVITNYIDERKIFYNVAEIIDSTAIDDEGNTVYATQDNPKIGTTEESEALKNGGVPQKIQDRDSEENSLITTPGGTNEQDIINTYSDRFISVYPGDSRSCIKGNYEYQDDDDFERVTIVESIEALDLSLRKSITKVGSDLNNMEDVTYENGTLTRLPIINKDSVEACKEEGTGDYYHRKDAVNVNAGDYVEYTIRVYNEGSNSYYAGYAGEIIDYLPENLTYVGIVNTDGRIIEGK